MCILENLLLYVLNYETLLVHFASDPRAGEKVRHQHLHHPLHPHEPLCCLSTHGAGNQTPTTHYPFNLGEETREIMLMLGLHFPLNPQRP